MHKINYFPKVWTKSLIIDERDMGMYDWNKTKIVGFTVTHISEIEDKMSEKSQWGLE